MFIVKTGGKKTKNNQKNSIRAGRWSAKKKKKNIFFFFCVLSQPHIHEYRPSEGSRAVQSLWQQHRTEVLKDETPKHIGALIFFFWWRRLETIIKHEKIKLTSRVVQQNMKKKIFCSVFFANIKNQFFFARVMIRGIGENEKKKRWVQAIVQKETRKYWILVPSMESTKKKNGFETKRSPLRPPHNRSFSSGCNIYIYESGDQKKKIIKGCFFFGEKPRIVEPGDGARGSEETEKKGWKNCS